MPTTEPWEVFLHCWTAETGHLPRISPEPIVPGESAPALLALDRARSRAWTCAHHVHGWPSLESTLAAGTMALSLVEWVRADGRDRETLGRRLRSAQEKGRARAVLGIHALTELEAELARRLELRLPVG